MKNKRTIYLNTVDINDAKTLFWEHFSEFRQGSSETIDVYAAFGRITAQPVYAKISNPHYNASAMDGIALNASVTYDAHERNPIDLKEHRDFEYVDTGDCIKEGYNAVVMIEDVYPKEAGIVEIRKASYPWEHIRVVGEDIAVGDMILPSNHRISAVDMGALLSAGITQMEVQKKMRVGLIPTGSEIVKAGEPLLPGSIIDSNSSVFESMVLEAGGNPKRYDPVKDDREMLRKALVKAVDENDMVVINAGSSAGSEDYTADLIRELGEVYVHGIAIKPGKPTILGSIHRKPVIGIPGYPVSAYISFRAFVVPFLQKDKLGEDKPLQPVLLSRRIVSALKHQEYVRMKIGKVGDQLIGTALSRGAGVTMSLVKADGILSIPKHVEGYEAGTRVEVELIKPLDKIKKAAVSIGSHDIIMDQLNDLMIKNTNGFNLSSAHVGSLGGIMALRKGETHIAPVHLLDEVTGEYNGSFIRKYLKNREVILVKGIKRWQGLYVEQGNPLNVKDLKAIAQEKYLFANRQKGSGTRTLLDYYLKKAGIDPHAIKGYNREFTTHTNVALSVKTGNSQVGLGIESVARKMELDFIPLALEDYDFIIPKEHVNEPAVQKFLEVLQSQVFKERLESLGGYQLETFKYVDFNPNK